MTLTRASSPILSAQAGSRWPSSAQLVTGFPSSPSPVHAQSLSPNCLSSVACLQVPAISIYLCRRLNQGHLQEFASRATGSISSLEQQHQNQTEQNTAVLICSLEPSPLTRYTLVRYPYSPLYNFLSPCQFLRIIIHSSKSLVCFCTLAMEEQRACSFF
jgi:hypothetical protein